MCQACEGVAQLRQACDGAAQLRPACDGGARLRHDGAAHHRLSRRSFGRGLLAAAIAPGCLGGSAEAIVDPRMRLMLPAGAPRTVALTLDACGGAADMRIIETLLDLSIPATIFLTELWLRGNAPAVALLRSRGDQFSLQNHGERHLPPVLGNRRVYGLPVAARRRQSAMRSRPAPTPWPLRARNGRTGGRGAAALQRSCAARDRVYSSASVSRHIPSTPIRAPRCPPPPSPLESPR